MNERGMTSVMARFYSYIRLKLYVFNGPFDSFDVTVNSDGNPGGITNSCIHLCRRRKLNWKINQQVPNARETQGGKQQRKRERELRGRCCIICIRPVLFVSLS